MLAYKDDKEFYESLPRKRVGVGALLFYKNQLLILQPSYSNEWVLPGGTVEAEESPLEGLYRSIKEELKIQISPTRLIAIDYVHNRDVKGEYIQFLFEAKELTERQAQSLTLLKDDFKEFKFVDLEEATKLLTTNAAKRLESALIALQDGQMMSYLEDGNLASFRAEMALL